MCISPATCAPSSPPPSAPGAAYARNAEALRAVQPEDVLPGDIDANLGAPWIPETDIQAFAAHLFGAPLDDITVVHLTNDAALEPGRRDHDHAVGGRDHGLRHRARQRRRGCWSRPST